MSRSRIVRDIFIALAVLSQVFTIGYYASKVITESELIGNACFEIDFTGTDIRFQKGWSMVIQRSQKPITFTLGKFTQLSVTVPLSVSIFLFSYFSNKIIKTKVRLCHNFKPLCTHFNRSHFFLQRTSILAKIKWVIYQDQLSRRSNLTDKVLNHGHELVKEISNCKS